jgi:hypothetical protein
MRVHLPIDRQHWDVRRGTGILPVGLGQAIEPHGQDAHATCATVNPQMLPWDDLSPVQD